MGKCWKKCLTYDEKEEYLSKQSLHNYAIEVQTTCCQIKQTYHKQQTNLTWASNSVDAVWKTHTWFKVKTRKSDTIVLLISPFWLLTIDLHALIGYHVSLYYYILYW